MSKFFLIRT